MSDGTLRFAERNSPPATPDPNTWGIYATSDGVYSIDDLGASVVLAATSDYNIAVATTDADGLLPKLSGSSDYFMDGTGNWGLPSPDGWLPAPGTWTASSDTITITTQAGSTDIYDVGDKLRFKQGGGFKFNYAIAVTDTTLTMTGSTDYGMTTDTITDNYYSKAVSPVGFPQWFNWVPTLAGLDPAKGTLTAKFSINGRVCHFTFYFILTALAGVGGGSSFTMPVTCVSTRLPFSVLLEDATGSSYVGSARYVSNTCTIWAVNSAGTYLVVADLSTTVPFTWTTSDKISIEGFYEI
jgi:hypothetical protein